MRKEPYQTFAGYDRALDNINYYIEDTEVAFRRIDMQEN